MSEKIQTDMTSEPVSIASDVTIGEAQEVMRNWGMRHLPVVDGAELVGVISDRDILRAFATQKSGKTEVEFMMTKSPYRVRQDIDVAAVAKAMAENKYGCAIVTDNRDQVIGVFTTTDALQLLSRILHSPDEVDYHILSLSEYFFWQKKVRTE